MLPLRCQLILALCGLLLQVLFDSKLLVRAEKELGGRCGDCWCIPDTDEDGDGEPDCRVAPTDGSIRDSFDDYPDMAAYYRSFELQNPDESFLKLQTADGSECYPFAESVGPLSKYPQSELPQCAKPDFSNEAAVCAFLYDNAGTGEEVDCYQRKYKVVTYDSAAAAEAAGAQITHSGPCGVCSTAQDFSVRIARYESLADDTVVCGTSFNFDFKVDSRFTKLADCMSRIGFTDACANAWAHYTATNAISCLGPCFPDAETGAILYNGPPPQCELEACLMCSANFTMDFNQIRGRTLFRSGITEVLPKACSLFTPVFHDPCINANASGIPKMEANSETTSGGWSSSGLVLSFCLSAMCLVQFF